MRIPQKTTKRMTIWHSNSTYGYVSEENEHTSLKRYMHPYVPCSIFAIVKIRRKPKRPSIHEGTKKIWCSEMRQTEKGKYQ